MKTWIDWMNRIAGGMLFHGGYVATPRLLVAGQAARVARDEHPEHAAGQRAGHDCQGQNRNIVTPLFDTTDGPIRCE